MQIIKNGNILKNWKFPKNTDFNSMFLEEPDYNNNENGYDYVDYDD